MLLPTSQNFTIFSIHQSPNETLSNEEVVITLFSYHKGDVTPWRTGFEAKPMYPERVIKKVLR